MKITSKKTFDRYTKPELIDKVLKSILSHQEFKKESDQIIAKLEEKIRKITKENRDLRAKSIEKMTDDDTLREILKLKATGKSPMRIYEVLNDNRGLDVEVSKIKSVCNNFDELSEEMKSYFNSQKKLYFDNLSFSKEYKLQGDVLTIERMIDSSKRSLESMDNRLLEEEDDFDYDGHRKLQDHISKLIKDKSAIMKLISGGSNDIADEEIFEIGYIEDESEELEGFSIEEDGDEE